MSEKDRNNRKLTANQNLALKAILEGHNQRESALFANVTARTIRRWRNQDALFATELESSSQLLIKDAKQQLLGSIGLAIDLLRKMMVDESAPPTVRLRAANSTLVHAVKILEIYDLDQRINAIELTLEKVQR